MLYALITEKKHKTAIYKIYVYNFFIFSSRCQFVKTKFFLQLLKQRDQLFLYITRNCYLTLIFFFLFFLRDLYFYILLVL